LYSVCRLEDAEDLGGGLRDGLVLNDVEADGLREGANGSKNQMTAEIRAEDQMARHQVNKKSQKTPERNKG